MHAALHAVSRVGLPSLASQFMQRAVEKDRPAEPAPVQVRASGAVARTAAAKQSSRPGAAALLRR